MASSVRKPSQGGPGDGGVMVPDPTSPGLIAATCSALSDTTLVPEASALALPRSFPITHTFAGFQNECEQPTVTAGFASACDPRIAETYASITFALANASTGGIGLVLGSNVVTEVTEGFQVDVQWTEEDGTRKRYGSCATVAGVFNISQFDVVTPATALVTFSLELGPCDATMGLTPITLEGVLDVTIPAGLLDFCKVTATPPP